MNLTITIPDDAVEDVMQYCRETNVNLQDELQQRVDTYVNKAVHQMDERRKTRKEFEQKYNDVMRWQDVK